MAHILNNIFLNLLPYFFLSLPIVIIWFFSESTVKYIKAKRINKKAPGTYSDKEIKKRLILLIISSVIFALFVWVIVEIIVILNTPIAFM